MSRLFQVWGPEMAYLVCSIQYTTCTMVGQSALIQIILSALTALSYGSEMGVELDR